MITGTHAIVYAEDADATRAFFRDVLELSYVDSGGGWLIFQLPPAEVGIHPTGEGVATIGHELFLTCDDIEKTVADLRGKGAEFQGEVVDRGWGLYATLVVPGAGTMGIYQPKHGQP